MGSNRGRDRREAQRVRRMNGNMQLEEWGWGLEETSRKSQRPEIEEAPVQKEKKKGDERMIFHSYKSKHM